MSLVQGDLWLFHPLKRRYAMNASALHLASTTPGFKLSPGMLVSLHVPAWLGMNLSGCNLADHVLFLLPYSAEPEHINNEINTDDHPQVMAHHRQVDALVSSNCLCTFRYVSLAN